mmetsp:Transcript_51207/g.132093  ORF Transcript_51207/g.132093 Transcript_51207/m.132093 type:complete len:140 (-) Transcript_51207:348-767(-)
MARIVRRSLRVQGLPLMSMPAPWGVVADASNVFPVGANEPRYLELARRIEGPEGSQQFGYTETSQRKPGGLGVLVKAEQIRWLEGLGTSSPEAVHLTGRGMQPFRILAMKKEESTGLHTAHVQLLAKRDLARLRANTTH